MPHDFWERHSAYRELARRGSRRGRGASLLLGRRCPDRRAELGGEVVIEANAAGLRTLAGHLLVLAGEGVTDGAHLHLDDGNGLEEGSVGLVLERRGEE
ncbi:hypothetical protein AB0E74_19040 [Streptomyces sp. NPDC030392]|uniref:Imm32 family immunity protein n=1 Tax=Streptomyces sp. NPDC030392 TaxID=3155468 RepID=UPI0033BFFD3A